MVVLRSRVLCFRCNNAVNKIDTIKTLSTTGEPRYQCSSCFAKAKTSAWGMGDKVQVKSDCFCQRCKYKFKSASNLCPYCSKNDMVVCGKITANDLL